MESARIKLIHVYPLVLKRGTKEGLWTHGHVINTELGYEPIYLLVT